MLGICAQLGWTWSGARNPKLGPRHRISKRGFHTDFLSFLHQSTQRTAATQEEIAHEGAIDSLLFANLASDLGSEPQVCQRDEGHYTTHQTVIANRLGRLAERVAGSAVSRQTKWNIIQAAAQSVTPFLGHLES